MELKTKLATPFCFLDIVKDLFPQQDMTELQLNTIMDLFLTCPETKDSSAEEMFFAALLSCFRIKGASPICFEIVKAITYKWQESLDLA